MARDAGLELRLVPRTAVAHASTAAVLVHPHFRGVSVLLVLSIVLGSEHQVPGLLEWGLAAHGVGSPGISPPVGPSSFDHSSPYSDRSIRPSELYTYEG